MKKFVMSLWMALGAITLSAQQSHVNVDWAPQKNTENITPFSARLISPEVHDDHTVTFRLQAPNAKEVLLTGNMFVGADARKRVPFTKDEKGVWTLTIGPLEPEIYFYYFIVDGVQNVDPNNTFTGHAAMPAFSILHVHGDGPAFYDAKPDVAHGSLTTHYYYSEVTKGVRDLIVYTPANYNPKKKYPTLYLMGGSGDLTETWVMHGKANFILDNLIAEGKAEPMIVVFPNDQMVTRSHPKHTELAFPMMEEEYRKCIIPFIESKYPVIKDRHARAISGLSMGGRLSQYVGFRCLDLFANFGLLSSAIEIKETPALYDKDINDKIDYLFVGAGTHETGFMARHVTLHKELDQLGIKHDYYVGSNGAHDLVAWKHLLYYRFLPGLWKNLKK